MAGIFDLIGANSGNNSGSLLDFLSNIFGPSQANAQPAQPQLPSTAPRPQLPPQQPTLQPPQTSPLPFPQRIGEAIGGLVHGGSPVGGLFNAINTLATGNLSDPSSIQQNNARIMYQNLRQQGLNHNQALMAIMSPKVGEAAGTEIMKGTINPNITIAPD